ncbi:MAG: hydrogenase formation protein HypD [Thermoprotei archaeon]|nr:hydrogenase formation protein HypD [Thermoprotei archaeon]
MKFISSYRDPKLAKRLHELIDQLVSRLERQGVSRIKIMNFCGTHEHTITYYGIRSLVPSSLDLIAGPGCPVCIVPAGYIDTAIKLAMEGVTIYTYGDMYRVPGSYESLAQARAKGANVKVVYGFMDAVRLARNEKKEAVFFGVGFETTQPTLASWMVRDAIPENLKLLLALRLTPPVMRYVLRKSRVDLDGVIAPGHVSTITGAKAWVFLSKEFNVPTVIAGFEPLDVLIAIAEILRQKLHGYSRLYNEYGRVVTWDGNLRAQEITDKVFEVTDGYWRGIGLIPSSSLRLRDKYASLDAIDVYGLKIEKGIDTRSGCKCNKVILGEAKPTDCPFFMKACTPAHPLGPCMVSSEGTCHIWAKYGGRLLLEKFELE